MSNLKGRTALVTGGAVRIGRAICTALAAEGVNIVIHYRKSARAAEELVSELKTRGGGDAFAVSAPDFRESGSCRALIDDTIAVAGGLDYLINSAAVFNKDSLFTLDAEKLRNEMEINLEAPTLLMQAFAGKCKQGKIINLLDRRVAGDDISCIPYLLSKKALREMTRLAALALAPDFTVNAVAPGNALPPRSTDPGPAREKAQETPLTADCGPAQVAKAVLFLLDMNCITGQTLFVDAGGHLV